MLSDYDKPGCPFARQNRMGAWVLCGVMRDDRGLLKCRRVPFEQCKWYNP